jgi:hypothetical protein
MKTGADALCSTENESGSAKHKNGIGRPRYRPKREHAHNTRKRDPTFSKPPKMSPGARKMKTGPDAFHTAKNVSGSAKTGADALGNVENESGSAKHENRSLHPPHRQKHVRERKT